VIGTTSAKAPRPMTGIRTRSISSVAYADDEPAPQAPQVEQRVLDAEEQIGRNDPCWCGSGQKYKKCHGA
jgi:preprotein translocase subunit SecA